MKCRIILTNSTNVGDKIKAVKYIRDLTGLGLKEAVDTINFPPKIIKEDLTLEQAKTISDRFTELGVKVRVEDENGLYINIQMVKPVSELEKNYRLMLIDPGLDKIRAIKEVRQLKNCRLEEAKDIVYNVPMEIKNYSSYDEASRAAEIFEKFKIEVRIEHILNKETSIFKDEIKAEENKNINLYTNNQVDFHSYSRERDFEEKIEDTAMEIFNINDNCDRSVLNEDQVDFKDIKEEKGLFSFIKKLFKN